MPGRQPGQRLKLPILMSKLRDFAEGLIQRLPPKLQPIARWRFIKFGMVGASGTVINVVVLYAAHWNRRLTWRDRRQGASPSALLLFGKYVAAAGLSIVLQSLLTKWLAMHMHYILANIVAIALASVCNFVANDRLTFRRSKPP